MLADIPDIQDRRYIIACLPRARSPRPGRSPLARQVALVDGVEPLVSGAAGPGVSGRSRWRPCAGAGSSSCLRRDAAPTSDSARSCAGGRAWPHRGPRGGSGSRWRGGARARCRRRPAARPERSARTSAARPSLSRTSPSVRVESTSAVLTRVTSPLSSSGLGRSTSGSPCQSAAAAARARGVRALVARCPGPEPPRREIRVELPEVDVQAGLATRRIDDESTIRNRSSSADRLPSRAAGPQDLAQVGQGDPQVARRRGLVEVGPQQRHRAIAAQVRLDDQQRQQLADSDPAARRVVDRGRR